MAKYKYGMILAIDPSGAYLEGKGTTGWCLLDAGQNKIVKTGFIFARDYDSKEAFWDAHVNLFVNMLLKYKTPVVAVIEDYILYASTAEAHINSRFETSKLIGILQYNFFKRNIPYAMQRAVDVKNRWTNEILIYKKIIAQKGKSYYVYDSDMRLNRHIIDSIRHAVHYNTFRNKKGE